MQWLDFCKTSGFPVPESNKVMMQISSAVNELLLEKSEDFQRLELYIKMWQKIQVHL